MSGNIYKKLAIPKQWRIGATALLGTMIGSLINTDILSLIIKHSPSIGIMLMSQLLLTFAGIWYFRKKTATDRTSTLFAAYPGAISQITALSLDHKCDAQMIAMNHTTRIFIVIAFIPLLITLFMRGVNIEHLPSTTYPNDTFIAYAWPIFIAIVGYLIGRRYKLMTPSLFGPMILAGILSITGLSPNTHIGEWLMPIAQVIIGASVGLRFKNIQQQQWLSIKKIHLPYALMLLAFTLSSSLGVHLLLDIPFQTCLLIMAPGGLSEMVIIAYTLDIDPIMVTVHHVVRSLFSLILIPWMMRFWVYEKSLSSVFSNTNETVRKGINQFDLQHKISARLNLLVGREVKKSQ